MKTLALIGLGVWASAPWLFSIVSVGASDIERGKDFTFAALVFFLVCKMIPGIYDKEHKAREKQNVEHATERETDRALREKIHDETVETLRTLGDSCHTVQNESIKVMSETRVVLEQVSAKLTDKS